MLYFSSWLARDVLPSARAPRAQQSEAALALLGALRRATRLEVGPSSKSHSRAMSAAAIAASGQVGVDVEFACPRRNQAGLAQFLLGEKVLADWPEIYRLWTFREAHFKAFGVFPDLQMMSEAHKRGRMRSESWSLGPMRVRHKQRRDRASGAVFYLCLVWSGADAAREITLSQA